MLACHPLVAMHGSKLIGRELAHYDRTFRLRCARSLTQDTTTNSPLRARNMREKGNSSEFPLQPLARTIVVKRFSYFFISFSMNTCFYVFVLQYFFLNHYMLNANWLSVVIIYRVIVTKFRYISMPAGFCRHLVGKTLTNVSYSAVTEIH